jgi:hypothetical protein
MYLINWSVAPKPKIIGAFNWQLINYMGSQTFKLPTKQIVSCEQMNWWNILETLPLPKP